MTWISHLLLRSGAALQLSGVEGTSHCSEHRADANNLHLGEVEESPQPGPVEEESHCPVVLYKGSNWSAIACKASWGFLIVFQSSQ